jgi:hypothetical protein
MIAVYAHLTWLDICSECVMAEGAVIGCLTGELRASLLEVLAYLSEAFGEDS